MALSWRIGTEHSAAYAERERAWVRETLPRAIAGGGAFGLGGQLVVRQVAFGTPLDTLLPATLVGVLACAALAWLIHTAPRRAVVAPAFLAFACLLIAPGIIGAAGGGDVGGLMMMTSLVLSSCFLSVFAPYPWLHPFLFLVLLGVPEPLFDWAGGVEMPWAKTRELLLFWGLLGALTNVVYHVRARKAFHAERALERLANEDVLTGLSNRAQFMSKGALALSRGRREGQPVALLLMDLDHFKQVNDTRGHAAGDEALKAFAELLQGEARPFDLIGRLGGEEFVWLLPGACAEEALERAQLLGARLRAEAFPVTGGPLRLTVSGGCVEVAPGAEGLQSALKRADVALYRAKAEGRDRFIAAAPHRGEGPAPLEEVQSGGAAEQDDPEVKRAYVAMQEARTLKYFKWLTLARVAGKGVALAVVFQGAEGIGAFLQAERFAVSLFLFLGLMFAVLASGWVDRRPTLGIFLLSVFYNLLLLCSLTGSSEGTAAWLVSSLSGVLFICLTISGWHLVWPMMVGKAVGSLPIFALQGILAIPPAVVVTYAIIAVLAGLAVYRLSEEGAFRSFRLTHALEGRATTDRLTGLLNRGQVLKVGEGEVARMAVQPQPLSLLMIDIDHFKAVNDTYGHAAGDRVLQAVAERVVGAGRSTDIVGRLGGEELLCILPACDLSGALVVAERIRARIGGSAVTTANADIPVTISVGVARVSLGESLEAAMARADAALYRAKAGGRDRVERAYPSAVVTQAPAALQVSP